MFSRIPDASKVAFFNLQQQLASAEYDLIDCQMMNPHLATLGVQQMHRNDFLKLLENNRRRHPNSGGEPWASQFQTTQASFPNG
jgi:leucyl/phenylalanyl-tRNA--protein transferase